MAGLTDKSRNEIARYRDDGSREFIPELTAAIESYNRAKAEREAREAEIQNCLNELEGYDEVVVSAKESIDSVALLIQERNWKGSVTIVDFEDSIHQLQQYAEQKGVPVDKAVIRPRK